MKKVIAIMAVSSMFLMAGCMSKGYKSEYVYNFVAACVQNGGAAGYCSCVMDVIQDKVTQKEFIDADAKFAAEKKFSDKFKQALEDGKTKCLK